MKFRVPRPKSPAPGTRAAKILETALSSYHTSSVGDLLVAGSCGNQMLDVSYVVWGAMIIPSLLIFVI